MRQAQFSLSRLGCADHTSEFGKVFLWSPRPQARFCASLRQLPCLAIMGSYGFHAIMWYSAFKKLSTDDKALSVYKSSRNPRNFRRSRLTKSLSNSPISSPNIPSGILKEIQRHFLSQAPIKYSSARQYHRVNPTTP